MPTIDIDVHSSSGPCAEADRVADSLTGTAYRAVRLLGQGSMGQVVEAERLPSSALTGGARHGGGALPNPRVVVKLLHAELADRPGLADRMRLEAEVLASLDHPNIVKMHELGATPAGRPFLVMERLVGSTLREELDKRGRFDVAKAVDIARQILAGLGAAHGAGILHRDIKPANLFVLQLPNTGGLLVKILDFGVAKVVRSGGSGHGPAPILCPTAKGMVVGTPRYLSPEQICARPVDGRADLYAAGLVLYELLVGRGPHPADRYQSAVEYSEELWAAKRLVEARGEEADTRPGEPAMEQLEPPKGGLCFGTGPMGATAGERWTRGEQERRESAPASGEDDRRQGFPSHSGEFPMHPGSKPLPPQLPEQEAARALAQTQHAGGIRPAWGSPERGPRARAETMRLPDALRDPSCIRARGGTQAGAAAPALAIRSGFVPVKTTQPMAIVPAGTRAPAPSQPASSTIARSRAWAEIPNAGGAGVRPMPELEAAARNLPDVPREPMRRRFDRPRSAGAQAAERPRGLPELPTPPTARRESLSGVLRAKVAPRTRRERAVIVGGYVITMFALLGLAFSVLRARALVAPSAASPSARVTGPLPHPALPVTPLVAAGEPLSTAGEPTPAASTASPVRPAPAVTTTSTATAGPRAPPPRQPIAAPKPRKKKSEIIDPWEK